MKATTLSVVVAVALGVATASTQAAVTIENSKASGNRGAGMIPDGKGGGISAPTANPSQAQSAASTLITGNGIDYHGGPIILGKTNIYYIWYGNWSGNTATSILTDLANNIGGTSYFNTNTTYYDGSSRSISNWVSLAGSTNDSYSQGTALSDSQIQSVVSQAINNHALPSDANGVYFVLTSPDVTATSGFCSRYCGWHTHATIAGLDTKYAFVGNAAQLCPGSCISQTSISPNGNVGADGMASVIAHELEETVTDPDLNAWYDGSGQENADKCAWTFGSPQFTVANGSKANVSMGARSYYIQQNWLNASGGYCTLTTARKINSSVFVAPLLLN